MRWCNEMSVKLLFRWQTGLLIWWSENRDVLNGHGWLFALKWNVHSIITGDDSRSLAAFPFCFMDRDLKVSYKTPGNSLDKCNLSNSWFSKQYRFCWILRINCFWRAVQSWIFGSKSALHTGSSLKPWGIFDSRLLAFQEWKDHYSSRINFVGIHVRGCLCFGNISSVRSEGKG